MLTCAGVWGQICIILWDAAFANLMQNWTWLTFFTICRSFISQVNLLRWNSFNHCNTMLTTEENSALVTRRSNRPCMYVTTYNCQVKSEINTIIFVMIEGVVVIINTFLNILDFSMWLDQLLALSNLWVKVESQNGLEHSSFSIFTALERNFDLFTHIFRSSKPSFIFWHAELLNNRSVPHLTCLQSWQKTWLWKGRRRMTDSVSRDRGRLVDANKAVMNKHTAPVYLDNIHTAPPIHAPSSVYANLLANATEHQANNKADS